MPVITDSAIEATSPPPYPIGRLTVEDYHRMIDAGVLTEDDPLELLEGWLAVKMTKGSAHDATIELIHETLMKSLESGWRIRIQSAITTPDSEPEPDLAVVRGPIQRHVNRHPYPEETPLVIEVADASLSRDRGIKAAIYARAPIPQYWIVNLIEKVVEVYSDPAPNEPAPHYRSQRIYRPGDTLPMILDGQPIASIEARDILP